VSLKAANDATFSALVDDAVHRILAAKAQAGLVPCEG
jgi:hypothetical protein